MDALWEEFRDQGFEFLFVYTKEAHPGERWPAHRSFQQKLDQALAYQHRIGCKREILVDSLDGYAHQLYGLRPDMTWILDRDGIVLFKSFWSRPDLTRDVIQDILRARADRKHAFAPGGHAHHGQPFYTERVAWRRVDSSHDAVMVENGPQAIVDYQRWLARMRQEQIARRREGPQGF